ncbi:MAG: leucine-rich repeat domain-containing protein, partial [Candidatus Limivicinus sp.]
MKRTAKRALALFLCAMLCVALLPAAAFAEETGVAIDESNFPDAVFREYISTNFDVDSDGVLSTEEINSVTSIVCEGYDLTSLEGIEFFPNLASLSCMGNQLTALDVSQNTALTQLDCESNRLTELNVSKNTALKKLYCTDNRLTELDLSQNTALTDLYCSYNQLTELDVSQNTSLESLDCRTNQLTELDVSGCTALRNLTCEINLLSSLDVSGCTALEWLNCMDNQLTELDVSGLTALGSLECQTNQLTELDVSGCTALWQLDCENNQLSSLDVSDCTALAYLYCNNNQLSTLDLSGYTALERLHCYSNRLTELDVSDCTALKYLQCYSNQLVTLNTNGCTALEYLDCNTNRLTALEASGCTALWELNCQGNKITTLNIGDCTALSRLNCNANQLSALDMSKNTALRQLNCQDNKITTLNVSACTELNRLNCNANQLTALDVSGNTALWELSCQRNHLTTLDLSNNTELNTVSCDGQTVTVEDFTQSGEQYLVDLSAFVGAENIGRITSVENGDYDAGTGIASFDAPDSFTYYYDTGYGDTLMAVQCGEEGKLFPDENGSYHITSFAQLKALLAEGLTEYAAIFYEGTEEFVFEEDLTLPEDTQLITMVDTLVPTGVKVTANGSLSVWDGTLYVEGTLVANNNIELQNINVSGSLKAYATISIPSTGTITGEENIVFGEGSNTTGSFWISYDVSTPAAFKAAVQEANLNKPNRYYSINLSESDMLYVKEELTLGENTQLNVCCCLFITETGALSVASNMTVERPITILGSLTNTGRIVLYWDDTYASMSLCGTGSYNGTGEITIYSDTLSSPAEILGGFDLADFDITDNGRGWTLRYAAGLEKLATPTNLKYGFE